MCVFVCVGMGNTDDGALCNTYVIFGFVGNAPLGEFNMCEIRGKDG